MTELNNENIFSPEYEALFKIILEKVNEKLDENMIFESVLSTLNSTEFKDSNLKIYFDFISPTSNQIISIYRDIREYKQKIIDNLEKVDEKITGDILKCTYLPMILCYLSESIDDFSNLEDIAPYMKMIREYIWNYGEEEEKIMNTYFLLINPYSDFNISSRNKTKLFDSTEKIKISSISQSIGMNYDDLRSNNDKKLNLENYSTEYLDNHGENSKYEEIFEDEREYEQYLPDSSKIKKTKKKL